MASQLYSEAVELLRREGISLDDFEDWLADRIAENLRQEAHLVGDEPFDDPTELSSFLRHCLERHDGSASDGERRDGFAAACGRFEGRGLGIPRDHLPDGLLRYCRSRRLVELLLERLIGRRARDDFRTGRMSPEDAFHLLTRGWNASKLSPRERLGEGTTVFATFEHPAGAPRGDAHALRQALALPGAPRRDEVLFEFSYPTDSVANHRFPTVADAGWTPEFLPAPEVAPDPRRLETCCGWTRSSGGHPPQPELVHDNAFLTVLPQAPRFVGKLA